MATMSALALLKLVDPALAALYQEKEVMGVTVTANTEDGSTWVDLRHVYVEQGFTRKLRVDAMPLMGELQKAFVEVDEKFKAIPFQNGKHVFIAGQFPCRYAFEIG